MIASDSIISEALLQINGEDLVSNPFQPRKAFPDDEISRLSASISAFGIMQPLRVKHDEVRGKWIIILGECRWIAGKRAGLTVFPCLPWTGEADDPDTFLAQLAENTARNALKPMEQARAIAKAKMMKKWSGKELAERIGLSGGGVSRAEALLTLPEDIQAMVDDGRVSAMAGYHISRLPDAISMRQMADAVAEGKVIGNAITDAVQAVVGKKKVKPVRERLSLPLEGGSLSLASDQPITWEAFNAMLERLRKVAKTWQDKGGDIAELGSQLRPK